MARPAGPVFAEDALRPISALQHLLFCERQCALIHIEGQWAESPLTLEGRHLHERADGPERREVRGDVVIVRGLHLRSLRLGLVGRADVVELHRDPAAGGPVPGLAGCWRPFPVEYKRGSPKPDLCDKVQLAAQAMCLEEMLEVAVPEGALFYGRPRRRCPVRLDARLRRATEQATARLHELLDAGSTPPAEREPKCRRCSLVELCMPGVGTRRSAADWLHQAARHEPAGADDEEG